MSLNNRRNFIKKTAGLLATGIIGKPLAGSAMPVLPKVLQEREMIYRTLGRTGIKIPVVSMGVMNANNPNLVKAAFKSGIRHFDTAWIYQGGKNESMIGDVFREMALKRDEFIIGTKVILDKNSPSMSAGGERKKTFLSRFEESIARLQTEYVDILYYHDLWNTEQATDPYIKEAFEILRKQGRIRATGFSAHNYWPELLTRAADEGFYDVVLLSYNYSMSHDESSQKAMEYAVSKGMGLVAMKTQCQQAWYKEGLPAEMQQYYAGKIMHPALLKWVLNNPNITTSVPGFNTYEQLLEDIGAGCDLEYSPEEKSFLEDHQVKLALQSVCRFCGSCKAGCPHHTDIPSLMRAHMYGASYGNYFMARTTHASIPVENGLTNCRDCKVCTAQCRNQVAIGSRIEELKMMMG
jgi:hypothetical protein